jgi:IMP dehydrogenase
MFKNLQQTYTFDDVLLVPQYSNIETRKSVDIGTKLRDIRLTTPIVSAPMDTVTEHRMATAMIRKGGLPILHRYNQPQDQITMYERVVLDTELRNPMVGAAVGTSEDDMRRVRMLTYAGVKIFCIDVAHGHHIAVERMIKNMRQKYGSDIHIMAGNIATAEAFTDLSNWGADSIRVGVGGGSICSTRIQTGHGVPTLQSIFDIVNNQQSHNPAAIIADGGIKTSGDIVKALAAGADAVMLGSMLSGTDESPGEVFEQGGQKFKAYRGMASKEAQTDWRGKVSSIEGIASKTKYKGSVSDVIDEINVGIRSGFSYSGVLNIVGLQTRAKFVVQTQAGQIESSTHILRQ